MKWSVIMRFTAFVLVLLQVMILAACGGANNGDREDVEGTQKTDGNETTAAVSGISLVDSDGKPSYTIVRPENAGTELIGNVSLFRKKLADSTGANFEIKSDWVKDPSAIDNNSHEILIGQTNREASAAAAGPLALNDYVIAVEDNKIVICGGSDKSTITALAAFIEGNLTLDAAQATVFIDSRIEYRHSYSGKDMTIDGAPISEYTIVYPAGGEPEDGLEIAEALAGFITDSCGVAIPITPDTKSAGGREIIIGSTSRAGSAALYTAPFGTFDYKISMNGDSLCIGGGSTFALYYAVKLLNEDYLSSGYPVDGTTVKSGSMYGKYLYERAEGAELRIMTNNVWDCDNNNAIWAAKGEDCSARVRSVGLAAVYMAYLPDVICFQEMSIIMINRIRNELKLNGCNYELLSFTSGSNADNTCILYRPDTVTLKNKGHHKFTYGNNGDSKGYTWGYFELSSTGEDFVVLSTHMWWKSESAQAGSDKWREMQAAEMVETTTSLIAQYDCPVFILGDFNTKTTSSAFKVFTSGGFDMAFKLAEIFRSNISGHHSCGPDGFAREAAGSSTYINNAIDHILLKNGGETRILTFKHARPHFYIKLSDHYPLFSDVILG